jgi:acyl-coenzyme A thioesterase PaaI-like protein
MAASLTALQMVESVTSMPGYTREIGTHVVAAEAGNVELALDRRPGLPQANGFIHGGVGLADHAGAAPSPRLPRVRSTFRRGCRQGRNMGAEKSDIDASAPVFAQTPRGTWLPDPIVRGPFDGMQGGAAAALMCAQAEALARADGLGFVSAFTTHFLKPVPLEELMVTCEPLRRGRRVSVLDTTLSTAAGLCAVGRATVIGAVPNASLPTLPKERVDPTHFPVESRPSLHGAPWFMDAMEQRSSDTGVAWFRLKRRICGHASVMAGVLPIADWAHGVTPPLGTTSRPVDAAIPNPDVTVHLFRAPEGAWIGLKAVTAWSKSGIGAGWAELFDEDGRIGAVAMSVAVTLLQR